MWNIVVDVFTIAALTLIWLQNKMWFKRLDRRLDQTYAEIHDMKRDANQNSPTNMKKGMWD